MALLHLVPSHKFPLLSVANPKIMKISSPGLFLKNAAQVSDIKGN